MIKRHRSPAEIILVCVRWYFKYGTTMETYAITGRCLSLFTYLHAIRAYIAYAVFTRHMRFIKADGNTRTSAGCLSAAFFSYR